MKTIKKQLIQLAGNKVTRKAKDKMTQELTAVTAEPRTRAVRRDKGQLITTPRDLVLLTWINEQQAISIDHLQILMARNSEKTEQLNNPKEVTLPAASRAITRWMKMEFVETAKINNRQWVWLSAKGIKNLDLEYGYYEPALYNHIHEVNKIRLYWENRKDRNNNVVVWTPERFIRKTQGKGSGKAHILSQHFPDGEINYNGKQVAIEVELSVKRGADRTKIINNYKVALINDQRGRNSGLFGYHYEGLIYYTSEKTHDTITKAFEGSKTVQVKKLSEIAL